MNYYLGKKISELYTENAQHSAEAETALIETIRNILVTKSFNALPFQKKRWQTPFLKANQINFRIASLHNNLAVLMTVVIRGFSLLILLIGVYQVMQSQITLGTIFALITISTNAMIPFIGLSEIFVSTQEVTFALRRLREIMDSPKENADSHENNPPISDLTLAGDITFKNVNFRYRDTDYENVLHQINFTIPNKSFTGIYGPNGTGKTTLIHLLNRLHEPSEGEIYLGSTPYKVIPHDQLRNFVGIVPQDIKLYSGTLLQNISLSENPNEPLALEAANLAGCMSFIEKYPKLLSHKIQEDGQGLSTGQRQRLSLARAIYHKAKILILDEPTSSMDHQNELLFLQTIQKLKESTTIVMISHRVESLKMCDQILFMEPLKPVQCMSVPQFLATIYHTD